MKKIMILLLILTASLSTHWGVSFASDWGPSEYTIAQDDSESDDVDMNDDEDTHEDDTDTDTSSSDED